MALLRPNRDGVSNNLESVPLVPRLAHRFLRSPKSSNINVSTLKSRHMQEEEKKMKHSLPILPLRHALHHDLVNLHLDVLPQPLAPTTATACRSCVPQRSPRSPSRPALILILDLFHMLIEETFVFFGFFGALRGLGGEAGE